MPGVQLPKKFESLCGVQSFIASLWSSAFILKATTTKKKDSVTLNKHELVISKEYS
jgi:hypothetical protein